MPGRSLTKFGSPGLCATVLGVGLLAGCGGVSSDPAGRGKDGRGAVSGEGAMTGGAGSTGFGGAGDSHAGAGSNGAGAGGATGAGASTSAGGNPGSAGGAGNGQEAATGGEGAGYGGGGGTAGASSGGAGSGAGGVSGGAGSGGDAAVSHEGLVYWFSADFGLEQVAALWQWEGRSSNEEVAFQFKYSAYPRLGMFAGSGRPAVVFDGQDDFLHLTAQDMSFVAGLTFFAVARTTSEEACNPMLVLSNGEEMDDVSFFRHEQAFSYEVGIWRGQAGAFVVGAPVLLDVTHAFDGSISLFLNGLAAGAASFALPPDIERIQNYIGFSSNSPCGTWSGELAEVLLYARVLSPDERRAIRAYLVEKWGCCTSPI